MKGFFDLIKIEAMPKGLSETLDRIRQERDFEATYMVYCGRDEKYRYAIVFGWQDGFDMQDDGMPFAEGTMCLCGKVAYQPWNSAMYEYDIDWLMPMDDEEVRDTEVTFVHDGDVEPNIADLIQTWKEWRQELIKAEDEED